MRSRPGLLLATLVAFAILIGLGVWQLERRAWKDALIERVEAARTAPARPVATLLAEADPRALDYRNASALCPGLAAARFVELYDVVDGRGGWRLISACPVEGDRYDAVLVDRGFATLDVETRPAVAVDDSPVQVAGPLRTAEAGGFLTPPARDGRWYNRDIAGMAAALGVARPAPVLLTASAPVPSGAGLRAAPLPTEIPNRHLEYALTWFGLAATLVAVYLALVLRSPARS